jgi:hypothetical protein
VALQTDSSLMSCLALSDSRHWESNHYEFGF